eukprot:scaffold24746_cov79-Isochrysis_galbana.AAC.1
MARRGSGGVGMVGATGGWVSFQTQPPHKDTDRCGSSLCWSPRDGRHPPTEQSLHRTRSHPQFTLLKGVTVPLSDAVWVADAEKPHNAPITCDDFTHVEQGVCVVADQAHLGDGVGVGWGQD